MITIPEKSNSCVQIPSTTTPKSERTENAEHTGVSAAKAAVVITNKGNWIVNVEDLPDTPYDGHTLAKSFQAQRR